MLQDVPDGTSVVATSIKLTNDEISEQVAHRSEQILPAEEARRLQRFVHEGGRISGERERACSRLLTLQPSKTAAAATRRRHPPPPADGGPLVPKATSVDATSSGAHSANGSVTAVLSSSNGSQAAAVS